MIRAARVRVGRIPGVVYLPRGDAHPTIDLVVGWRTDGPENVIAQTLTRLHALVAMG